MNTKPALSPVAIRQHFFFIICLWLLLAFPVNALDSEKKLQISGFLSFGGGLSDANAFPGGDDLNDSEDTANPDEETPKYTAGSGRSIFDDTLSFNQDTRAGLQFNFIVDEKTSAILQFTSRGSVNNYEPALSWANMSYSITPDLTVRGGRFYLPIYLASDYLDVGLALPWIRPPMEVYSTINLSNITGVDLLYAVQVGDWVWRTQPFLGVAELERGDFTAEFQNIYGFNSSLNGESLALRVAYMSYEYFVQPWPLGDKHELLIQQLLAVGMGPLEEYMDPNGKVAQFLSLGFVWQVQNGGLQAEWVRRNGADFYPDIDGYYMTFHYQYKNWQPHVTFAVRKERYENKRFHPDMVKLEAISPELAAFTKVSVHSSIGIEDNESKSVTLGLNYTISDSMVGKLEFSEIRNIESTGLFEFATENDTNHIVSFVLDLAF